MSMYEDDHFITIRGRSFKSDAFKIYGLEEDGIPRIIDAIRGVAKFARNHPTHSEVEDIVNHSPLFHIEGLIRCQLKRHLNEFPHLSIEDLSGVTDFMHEEQSFEELNSPKISFLFNFLRNVVGFSTYPENIDERDLEGLVSKLHGLFFSAEYQLNASKKRTRKASHKELLVKELFCEFVNEASGWGHDSIKNASIKQIADKIYRHLRCEGVIDFPSVGLVNVEYIEETEEINFSKLSSKKTNASLTRSQLESHLRKVKEKYLEESF